MRLLWVVALSACVIACGHNAVADPPTAAPALAATTEEHDAGPADLVELAGKQLHLTKLVSEGKEVTLPSNGEAATLEISAQGRVAGRGPVNRYFGNMRLGEHGEVTWVGPFGSTKMAGPPERMELENQFMGAFESAKHLVRTSNGLRFENSDNTSVLTFSVQ